MKTRAVLLLATLAIAASSCSKGEPAPAESPRSPEKLARLQGSVTWFAGPSRDPSTGCDVIGEMTGITINGQSVTLGTVRKFDYHKDNLFSCRQDARYEAEIPEADEYTLAMGDLQALPAEAVDLDTFDGAYSAQFHTDDVLGGGEDDALTCYDADAQRCQNCGVADVLGNMPPDYCITG